MGQKLGGAKVGRTNWPLFLPPQNQISGSGAPAAPHKPRFSKTGAKKVYPKISVCCLTPPRELRSNRPDRHGRAGEGRGGGGGRRGKGGGRRGAGAGGWREGGQARAGGGKSGQGGRGGRALASSSAARESLIFVQNILQWRVMQKNDLWRYFYRGCWQSTDHDARR